MSLSPSNSSATRRLYYEDAYLTEFRARIVDASADRRTVYLDRTAFYPTSGGQPFDLGTLSGCRVEEVVDEGDRIAHKLESAVAGDEVEGRIDWGRRFDHMQQHTGQHLLSAVLMELYGFETVSFHLGSEASTIDLAVSSVSPDQSEAAELRANQMVWENRTVRVSVEENPTDLRKESQRLGALRIITIDRLDRSACGGTHVRSTGEIGCILLRGMEKIRGTVRIQFLCGNRAIARARADYKSLSAIGRACSAEIDDTPALVVAQLKRLRQAETISRKLATELAQIRGTELYKACSPNSAGLRFHRADGVLDEDMRTEAQAFTRGDLAVYLACSDTSLLLACSADSRIHAGDLVKAITGQLGGKGGGSAQLAQASFANTHLLQTALAEIEARLTT